MGRGAPPRPFGVGSGVHPPALPPPPEFVHIVAVELVAQALKGKKRTITAANAVDALKDLGFGDYAEDAEADGDAAMVAHVRSAAPPTCVRTSLLA